MAFRKQILTLLSLLLPLFSWCQLVLQLNNLPSNTPAGSDIYVAGSFNDWAPGNTDYVLSVSDQGVPRIELNLAVGTYEFKFTRGSWATVEGNVDGGFLPNRSIVYNGGLQQENLTITGWEGLTSNNSTASANVELLAEFFYIPQLDRQRKIWVYLPPNYHTTSQRYPVMYMHDAQNLFDAATSFSGEWEVDESLNWLFQQGDPGIIIIGINNGGPDRLAEYTPWSNPNYGGGEGDEYVDFLVQTLKPYVDENYRTLADQSNTGIMGSSLGGLISLYAGIRHQDVFGKIGALSPSFWFTDDIYDFVADTGAQQSVRIAMLGGQEESSSMVADLERMFDTLDDAGFNTADLALDIHPDGQHSEWYWRREFPSTYQWLFQDATFVQSSPGLQHLSCSPNPATSQLTINGLLINGAPWLGFLYDSIGRQVQNFVIRDSQLEISTLPQGTYTLVITDPSNQWVVLRFQKI